MGNLKVKKINDASSGVSVNDFNKVFKKQKDGGYKATIKVGPYTAYIGVDEDGAVYKEGDTKNVEKFIGEVDADYVQDMVDGTVGSEFGL